MITTDPLAEALSFLDDAEFLLFELTDVTVNSIGSMEPLLASILSGKRCVQNAMADRRLANAPVG